MDALNISMLLVESVGDEYKYDDKYDDKYDGEMVFLVSCLGS